jgi:hypothetical protein
MIVNGCFSVVFLDLAEQIRNKGRNDLVLIITTWCSSSAALSKALRRIPLSISTHQRSSIPPGGIQLRAMLTFPAAHRLKKCARRSLTAKGGKA